MEGPFGKAAEHLFLARDALYNARSELRPPGNTVGDPVLFENYRAVDDLIGRAGALIKNLVKEADVIHAAERRGVSYSELVKSRSR